MAIIGGYSTELALKKEKVCTRCNEFLPMISPLMITNTLYVVRSLVGMHLPIPFVQLGNFAGAPPLTLLHPSTSIQSGVQPSDMQ